MGTKRVKPFAKKDTGPIVLLAVLTIIPYAVQPYLIASYGSAFIGMMVIFVPLLTILVSLPMLKKIPARREVTGVGGGLVFAWILVYDGLNRELAITDLLIA